MPTLPRLPSPPPAMCLPVLPGHRALRQPQPQQARPRQPRQSVPLPLWADPGNLSGIRSSQLLHRQCSRSMFCQLLVLCGAALSIFFPSKHETSKSKYGARAEEPKDWKASSKHPASSTMENKRHNDALATKKQGYLQASEEGKCFKPTVLKGFQMESVEL